MASNYSYSFRFFNIQRPVSTCIWRINDATRHDTTRGATHTHTHTHGARGIGACPMVSFPTWHCTGRDAPGSESTTPLNRVRGLRRCDAHKGRAFTHERRVVHSGLPPILAHLTMARAHDIRDRERHNALSLRALFVRGKFVEGK